MDSGTPRPHPPSARPVRGVAVPHACGHSRPPPASLPLRPHTAAPPASLLPVTTWPTLPLVANAGMSTALCPTPLAFAVLATRSPPWSASPWHVPASATPVAPCRNPLFPEPLF